MSFAPLSKIFRRLRFWLQRERLERELREEIDEHRRLRGPASVPRPAVVMEEARAVWIPPTLASIVQDLRYGVRQLNQNRLVTFVCVAGLAIAIGLNTAVFSVIEAIYWRPFPVTAGDRVVRLLRLDANDRAISRFSEDELRHYQDTGLLEAVTGFAVDSRPVAEWPHGAVLSAPVAFAAPNFFEMLGGSAVLGRVLAPVAEHDALLITETAWRRRLQARPDAVGARLTLNGVPFTIVGVLPDRSAAIIGPCDALLPLAAARRILPPSAPPLRLQLVARLPAGMDIDQANAAVAVATQRWFAAHPEDTRSFSALAVPARLAGGEAPSSATSGPEILLPVAALLVLVIACANLTNLLLARAEARRREMAVRLSLGAGRGRLIRQLLTECFLLTTLAGLLGLAAANAGMRLAMLALPRYLPAEAVVPWLDVGVNATVFSFALLLCSATAALFGLVPALEATQTSASGAMKGGAPARHGTLGARLRDVLIAVQMAACVTLLVLTASLHGAMSVLEDYVSSLDAKPILQAHVFLDGFSPTAVRDYFRVARERLAALPDVESVAVTSYPMLRGFGQNAGAQLEIEGDPHLRQAPSMHGRVSDGIPSAFNLPLTRGRDFTAAEIHADAPVVMINAPMAADLWPGANPLGQRFRLRRPSSSAEEPWLEVIGVVAEKPLGEGGAASHCILRPLDGSRGGILQIRTRTGANRPATMAAIRARLREVDSRITPGINSLEVFVGFVRWGPRLTSIASLSVALVSLWMAAAGLYGVTAYAAARRTKEIGIRMALGAQPAAVLRLMVRQGSLLVAAGLVVGSAAAWAAERVLSSAFRLLPPRPPATYLGVAAFLGAVALAAMLVPSRRAASLNPVAALRHDG